jgi:hypothetical protein
LRGETGKQGPLGPAAVKYFAAVAAVAADGETLRGNSTTSDHTDVGSGVYSVGFARSVSKCVYHESRSSEKFVKRY